MASTFTNNNTNWRVRADGSANNGGGFCPYVTNAGTDYTDQAAPQVSGTLGTVTAASTTFIDATATFTAAMVGNVMQITSATGGSAAAVDYYTIVAWTNATTITLDRSPATTTNITAATWAVGGAFLTLSNLALTATGSLPVPVTPAPLVVGNTIFLRGSGSTDPGTNDYDWSGGTWTFLGNSPIIVNGVCTNLITIVGYNGRPRIAHCGNVINAGAGGGSSTSAGWDAKHISFFRKLGTNNTPAITYTGNNTATPLRITDCIFDQNGFDSPEYWGIGGGFDYNEVRNTGGGTVGASVVVGINHPGCSCIGNYIHGVRGTAVAIASSASFISTTHPVFAFNHIVNNLGDGIQVILQNAATLYNCVIVHNTIDNNGGNGIVVGTSCMSYLSCFNNIISNHVGSGKSAISFTDSYQVNAQLQKHPFDANCLYGNTTNFNTVSASPAWVLQVNDITSNPGYVNAAAGNYKTSASVNGKGISGLGGVAGTIGAATQSVNMGAYQGVAATSPLNVSFTVTEGIETASATASVPIAVVSSLTESADTVSTNATIIVSAVFNSTEALETVSSASVLPVSSTFNTTESPDTLSSSESMPIAITSNLTESPETITSSVITVVNAANITFTTTESPDSLSTTSTLPIAVNFITTELPDTLVASENLLITVSSSILESPDAVSSTVFTVVSPANVSFTVTESPDAMTGSVASQMSIIFSVSESADSLTASGILPISSNYIVTESSDTITTSIVTVVNSTNVAFNVTELADSLVSNSAASMSIVLSTIEGSDTLVSTLASLNSVTFSVVESPDSLTASGLTTVTITGTIAEGADTLVSTLATVLSSINIAANITESSDILTTSFSTIVYVLNTGNNLFNVEDYHEFEHAPNASLDYGLDWNPWLAVGETIVISNWTLDTPLAGSLMQVMSGVTSLFVTGGVAGKIYKVTNTVTTSLTRSDSRTLYLSCKLR